MDVVDRVDVSSTDDSRCSYCTVYIARYYQDIITWAIDITLQLSYVCTVIEWDTIIISDIHLRVCLWVSMIKGVSICVYVC